MRELHGSLQNRAKKRILYLSLPVQKLQTVRADTLLHAQKRQENERERREAKAKGDC